MRGPKRETSSRRITRACRSHPRLGEARHARLRRTPAQVEPPGEREAGRVEHQIDLQRQLRTPGDGDRLAGAAWDQVAAAGADRADESERGTALDAGCLQGQRPAGFAAASCLSKILLAEN